MNAPASTPAPLVVYDLDGVITRKDTFARLVTRRLLASPLGLVRALPTVLSWAVLREPERRARVARRAAELALRGLSDGEYTAIAEALGASIGADPAWIRSSTVERIRQEHATGRRVVIATASEHRLAEALLGRAEVPYDLLSASALVPSRSGVVIADHRVGSRKAEALREAGVPIEEAEFVTDSATDLPTARLAARVVLIGATSRTRARFERERVRLVP